MTTVKCGYEGCEWQYSYSMAHIGDQNRFNELALKAHLLDHQVQAHNVPPAIWER